MGIRRTVTTKVICDICGNELLSWVNIRGEGVSKLLASIYARERGATVGKRVTCKACRIKRRMKACKDSITDGGGACMGWAKSDYDGEPIEKCKHCIACSAYDWEAGDVHTGR